MHADIPFPRSLLSSATVTPSHPTTCPTPHASPIFVLHANHPCSRLDAMCGVWDRRGVRSQVHGLPVPGPGPESASRCQAHPLCGSCAVACLCGRWQCPWQQWSCSRCPTCIGDTASSRVHRQHPIVIVYVPGTGVVSWVASVLIACPQCIPAGSLRNVCELGRPSPCECCALFPPSPPPFADHP
jgi:hypothetical protein